VKKMTKLCTLGEQSSNTLLNYQEKNVQNYNIETFRGYLSRSFTNRFTGVYTAYAV